jgi:hypothetical protein
VALNSALEAMHGVSPGKSLESCDSTSECFLSKNIAKGVQ